MAASERQCRTSVIAGHHGLDGKTSLSPLAAKATSARPTHLYQIDCPLLDSESRSAVDRFGSNRDSHLGPRKQHMRNLLLMFSDCRKVPMNLEQLQQLDF